MNHHSISGKCPMVPPGHFLRPKAAQARQPGPTQRRWTSDAPRNVRKKHPNSDLKIIVSKSWDLLWFTMV